jgi:hypothetical protein
MKRTKKQRVEELNRIIKDVPNYQFGLMPRGYAPYSLNHDGKLYSGGYYKEVRAMALRMKYARNEKLISMLFLGVITIIIVLSNYKTSWKLIISCATFV